MNQGTGVVTMEGIPGWVFDIQRYSLHDGPGLRTNVFFQGCPLGCAWCCNPESQAMEPQMACFENRCFACGDCLVACPQGALHLVDGRLRWDPRVCDGCGRCGEVCPSQAIQWLGRRMTAGEVLAEVLRDAAFYAEGGGVTLTGGEPLAQLEFAYAILRLARREVVHTALETCGHVPWACFERVLPDLDLVLYDLKHMDSERHRRGTGVGNERILDNARRVARCGVAMLMRVPLIPGFNMDAENVRRTARFALELGVGEVHLLPYHRLGRPKYRALGLAYPGEAIPLPQDGETEAIADIFRARGLRVQVGG
jgi:pyruvate formate lyase activating enzyme